MDSRIRKQAQIVAEHSTDIQKGDYVVIISPPAGEELVTALHEEIGNRGAIPVTEMRLERSQRAYLDAIETEDIAEPEHSKSLYEDADVVISLRGESNMAEMSNVPPEKTSEYDKATRELTDIRLSKRWCVTQLATNERAHLAEMSIDSYEDFVFKAIDRDWESQRAFQENLVEILNEGEQIRIRSGDATDLSMSISNQIARNDYGEHNMPGGEVFTAPVVDSVEGTVVFDKPLYIKNTGRQVKNVELKFEDGKVVDFDVDSNRDVFEELLNTDEGARYLGELGIGMNRAIDQFTNNILFDEKMGDTVHLALGRAYEDTVGDGNEQNQSAIHQDMIVDMSEESSIEVDGEIIQEDGAFAFED